ncbi:acetylglutamate kinase [candidate division MSBL1 archaeon SCGC-AAA385D11]|uniref:Acetylglutamate kinase n=1 Tax=candidate division MSBL1 archaeon SCGC-AAA385D11 TaxID=1698286 RepID=A0A133VNX0_9EURY|nr:acetylglutamate kinase [candidate division MSBL1 archaeon SCGC-AAA385D11]
MKRRASVLLEALPYIRRFHGKILVLKLGGALMEEKLMDSICQDIVLLNYVGMKPLVVHGGGSDISEEMEKAGKKPKFIEGLRVTDEETMDIIYKSLGKINKKIVLGLGKHGGKSIGISGIDGGLVRAKKVEGKGKEKLGLVGEVEEIDASVVNYLINTGYIPVIAPMGADAEGTSLNLNADTVAAELSTSLQAEKFILLTDVPGVLEDQENKNSLIPRITLEDAQKLIEEKTVTEGMITKLKACAKSVKGGVKRAHIINGTTPHALLLELLTESGVGTMIEEAG